MSEIRHIRVFAAHRVDPEVFAAAYLDEVALVVTPEIAGLGTPPKGAFSPRKVRNGLTNGKLVRLTGGLAGRLLPTTMELPGELHLRFDPTSTSHAAEILEAASRTVRRLQPIYAHIGFEHDGEPLENVSIYSHATFPRVNRLGLPTVAPRVWYGPKIVDRLGDVTRHLGQTVTKCGDGVEIDLLPALVERTARELAEASRDASSRIEALGLLCDQTNRLAQLWKRGPRWDMIDINPFEVMVQRTLRGEPGGLTPRPVEGDEALDGVLDVLRARDHSHFLQIHLELLTLLSHRDLRLRSAACECMAAYPKLHNSIRIERAVSKHPERYEGVISPWRGGRDLNQLLTIALASALDTTKSKLPVRWNTKFVRAQVLTASQAPGVIQQLAAADAAFVLDHVTQIVATSPAAFDELVLGLIDVRSGLNKLIDRLAPDHEDLLRATLTRLVHEPERLARLQQRVSKPRRVKVQTQLAATPPKPKKTFGSHLSFEQLKDFAESYRNLEFAARTAYYGGSEEDYGARCDAVATLHRRFDGREPWDPLAPGTTTASDLIRRRPVYRIDLFEMPSGERLGLIMLGSGHRSVHNPDRVYAVAGAHRSGQPLKVIAMHQLCPACIGRGCARFCQSRGWVRRNGTDLVATGTAIEGGLMLPAEEVLKRYHEPLSWGETSWPDTSLAPKFIDHAPPVIQVVEPAPPPRGPSS